MVEKNTLKKRSEVCEQETWDLKDLYPSDAAWETAFEACRTSLPALASFMGKLKEEGALLAALEALYTARRVCDKLNSYAHMKRDEDANNETYQTFADRAMQLYTQMDAQSSYLVPEILALDEAWLSKWLEQEAAANYRFAIAEMLRLKQYTLTPNEERILAMASEVTRAPENVFSMMCDADMHFPMIDTKDGKQELGHGAFMNILHNGPREDRKTAFEAYYKLYKQQENTFAATLQAQIKGDVFHAKARGYDNARLASLSVHGIDESVYDSLVEAVHGALPSMHRYIRLRKRLMKLSDMHMYDIYVPMLEGHPMHFTFEEGKQVVLGSLAPMGEEYVKALQEGFNNRWIDIYENKGKNSGAYCGGCYDAHPYVLLNYREDLDGVSTLAHEMGHALHSYFSNKAQPYPMANYSLFVAEVASIFNEGMLTEELLKKNPSIEAKCALINHQLDNFRTTLFRQTMFAEFEHTLHQMVESGQPLTTANLCTMYAKLNAQYYGDAILTDPEIAYEWARIPHFYFNYYVYQYATGFSAAMALKDRIVAGEEGALEGYLGLLHAGGSKNPIDLLKDAGVDMRTKEPVARALAMFDGLLDELEALLHMN